MKTCENWLLVEPEASELPTSNAVREHLRRGGNIHILFGPEAARDTNVQSWIVDQGLRLRGSVGLALAENRGYKTDSLFVRGEPIYLRDIRTVTIPLDTALLRPLHSNALVQNYTMRPTKLPRENGVFSVGFAADQFADEAMGEVWDGVHPSVLGSLRERQMAAILNAADIGMSIHEFVGVPGVSHTGTALSRFLVLKDGNAIVQGERSRHNLFEESGDQVEQYLTDLERNARAFVVQACPATGQVTKCARRYIAPDLIEWLVIWS